MYIIIKEIKNWSLIYSGGNFQNQNGFTFTFEIIYQSLCLLFFSRFFYLVFPSPSSPSIIVQDMLIKAQFWLQNCLQAFFNGFSYIYIYMFFWRCCLQDTSSPTRDWYPATTLRGLRPEHCMAGNSLQIFTV